MPYEICWEDRGVVKRHYGHLSARELVAAAHDVQGDSRFDRLRYIINDFTDVTSHEIDADTVEEFAASRIGAARVNRDILSPFVATGEPGLGIVRCLRQPDYRNRHPVALFATLAEARAWVDAVSAGAVAPDGS